MNSHPTFFNTTLKPEDILYLRKSLGLSQDRFGKLIDVATITVALWENGKNIPSTQSLKKLTTLMEKIDDYHKVQKKEEALASKDELRREAQE